MGENQEWIRPMELISVDLPGAEGGNLGRDYIMKSLKSEGVKGVSDRSKGHPGRVHKEGD